MQQVAQKPILRAAEEAKIYNVLGGQIRILGSYDESGGEVCFVEGTLPAGYEGPPMHYHDGYAEAFYVTQGRLSVETPTSRIIAGPGDSFIVPPNSAHRFENTSREPVKFVTAITAPFDRFFEEMDLLCKGGEPLASDLGEAMARSQTYLATGSLASKAFARRFSEGLIYNDFGAKIRILAGFQETDQRMVMVENSMPPHYQGPPMHYHARFAEVLSVVEGTVTFETPEGTIEGGPGFTAVIPAGAAHKFSNRSGSSAKIVGVAMSAFDQFFADVDALLSSGMAPELEALVQIAAKYDSYAV